MCPKSAEGLFNPIRHNACDPVGENGEWDDGAVRHAVDLGIQVHGREDKNISYRAKQPPRTKLRLATIITLVRGVGTSFPQLATT